LADAGDSLTAGIRYLLGIEDVSCIVADALDRLGTGGTAHLTGVFPAGRRVRVCGPAFTVRYEARDAGDSQAAEHSQRASFDFAALFARARPGDVAVFESPAAQDSAVLGSMGAGWAQHHGLAGCVINGGVRDVEALTASGLPVWARHLTPLAGRGRLVQAEVGGPVAVGGTVVRPGGIVVADGNGVAMIPAGSLGGVCRIVAGLQEAEAAATGPLRA
jgi:4-hydroxy-4-methyl-2-oxoglutarate aldolase